MNPKEPRLRIPTATAAGPRMLPHEDQCRCGCGALLARVVREGLEIKCRKCKTIVLISHDELAGMYRSLDLEPPPLPVR